MDLVQRPPATATQRDLPDDPSNTLPKWLVICTFVLLALVYLVQHRHDLGNAWFEDMTVYETAVRAYMTGANPYAEQHLSVYVPGTGAHAEHHLLVYPMYFVYPPVVLSLLAALAKIMPWSFEWALIGGIHIACVLAAPLVLARFYLQRPWLTPAMAMLVLLAEPLYTGVRALYSANVAPSLYLFALLAAVPGLRRNRWYWFYLVVFLASAVKVTMLLLLLLPLLIGMRQWIPSALTVVAVAGVNKLQQVLMPAHYAGFRAALLVQVAVNKRYGLGVFGTVAIIEQKFHGKAGIVSYGVHALFAAILVGLLFWLRQRGANTLRANGNGGAAAVWLGIIIIACVMVNPRVLHYDIYLALFAAFVVLVTALRLHGWKIIGLLLGLFLPSFILILLGHIQSVPETWQLLVVLAALAAGITQLWRETAPARSSVSIDLPESFPDE